MKDKNIEKFVFWQGAFLGRKRANENLCDVCIGCDDDDVTVSVTNKKALYCDTCNDVLCNTCTDNAISVANKENIKLYNTCDCDF